MNYKIIKKIIIGALCACFIMLFFYYQDIYMVAFDTKGGTLYESINVKPNSIIEKPNDPVMEGFIFEGWYLDGKEYNFDSKVQGDIILVAKWRALS